jgi:2-oxoglutarate dehydrogenase complex dehydrogenase (E1) component-like enzyme
LGNNVFRKEFPKADQFGVPYDHQISSKLDSSSYIGSLGFNRVEELEAFLHKTYLNKVGVEFEHVWSANEREWLYNKFEELSQQSLKKEQQKTVLQLLIECEVLKKILDNFPSFSIISFTGSSKLSRDTPEKVLKLFLFS